MTIEAVLDMNIKHDGILGDAFRYIFLASSVVLASPSSEWFHHRSMDSMTGSCQRALTLMALLLHYKITPYYCLLHPYLIHTALLSIHSTPEDLESGTEWVTMSSRTSCRSGPELN